MKKTHTNVEWEGNACMPHYQPHFCCVNKIAPVSLLLLLLLFSGGKFIIYLICLFCVSITLTSLDFFFTFHFNKCVAKKNNNNNRKCSLLFLLLLIFRLLASYLIRIVSTHTENKPHLYIYFIRHSIFISLCKSTEIWERAVYACIMMCSKNFHISNT